MAIYLISYAVQDYKGSVARIQVPVPRGALSIAQVEGYMQLLGEPLDNILDGKIVAADLRVGLNITPIVGQKTGPVLNSDVEEGANMSYAAAGTDYSFSIRLPAFAAALFSGKAVNDQSQLVQEFNSAITAGLSVGGTTVSPSDRYENDLITFIRGTKTFRK